MKKRGRTEWARDGGWGGGSRDLTIGEGGVRKKCGGRRGRKKEVEERVAEREGRRARGGEKEMGGVVKRE